MVADKPPPLYGLTEGFECAVAAMAATQPRFYGRIGYAVDPSRLKASSARLVFRACHAIKAEMGSGPAQSVLVVQRLSTWMAGGKVTFSEIQDAVDMLDDAEDAGFPSEDEVVNELRPVLAAAIRREAVKEAVRSHGRQGDLSRVVALEQQAERLGSVDTSVGVVVGAASFDDIAALRRLDRLPTHIPELDLVLNGGHQRGGLAVWCGNTGAGKSMGLSHQAGVSAIDGHVVAAVTLELPRAIWQARVIACVTGIPIDALTEENKEVDDRALELLEERMKGIVVVHQMPAQGTTVRDITNWYDAVEQFLGKEVDVRITDYMDKVSVMNRGKEVSSYDAGKEVAEGLRADAEEHAAWAWSGSQSKGRDRKKRLDTSDAADSINKPRAADLWLTLNVDDDSDEVSIFVAKHRTVKDRVSVGPLPKEFDVGRIAPIEDF